jgi:hypothetical protein
MQHHNASHLTSHAWRIVFFFLLLLAGTAWGAITAVRSYEWNGKRYTVCRLDDGSTVEIKGTTAEKADDALVRAAKWQAAMSVKVPPADPRTPLSAYSDAEILAEVKRRGLTGKKEVEVVKSTTTG